MIEVENEYDFTVEELMDIFENTPLSAERMGGEGLARYVIQALNINRMIKQHQARAGARVERQKNHTAPYHMQIVRNADGEVVFEKDVRSAVFYAYDPKTGDSDKVIVSEKAPTKYDVANICELLGSIKNWGALG